MRTTIRRTHTETATDQRVLPSPPADPQPAVEWDFGSGLRFVWRWRMAVIGLTLAITLLTGIYNWRAPDQYTATAMLLSNRPSSQVSSLAGLGPSITMALGGAGLSSDKIIYPLLLRTRSVIEPILDQPLPTRPGSKTDNVTLSSLAGTIDPELACESVRGMMTASTDHSTGVTHVAMTMADPVTAAAACNALVRSMSKRGVSFRTADAEKVRNFIADRLVEIKTELQTAEQRLRDFRSKNLNYARTIDPDLRLADEQLARDVRLKSNLYLQLFQEYESARIEEKRDIASVQILDSAYTPVMASGPRRLRNTVTAGVASGPLAVAALLFVNFIMCSFKPRKRDGNIEDADEI